MKYLVSRTEESCRLFPFSHVKLANAKGARAVAVAAVFAWPASAQGISIDAMLRMIVVFTRRMMERRDGAQIVTD